MTATNEPIRAYASEKQAKAVVEKEQEIRDKYTAICQKELWPYEHDNSYGAKEQSDVFPFPSRDGRFYATAKEADDADRVVAFFERRDVQSLRSQMTGVAYVMPVDFVE